MTGGKTIPRKDYEYITNNNFKYSKEAGGSGNRFDRPLVRDFAGRIINPKPGAEARGSSPSPAVYRPYLYALEYDALKRKNLNWKTWRQAQANSPPRFEMAMLASHAHPPL